MSHLKVCFVGIGSIARRHIRNLTAVCEERHISLRIDALRRFPEAVEGVDNIISFKEMSQDYDIIFITNPTELHLDTLRRLHNNGKHFFIEKPVVAPAQIEEAELFQTRSDSLYYVACPLRYNPVVQYLKNNIDPSDVLSVRSISSSYLPDWRPNQDYRKCYSAHKNMGGGVSVDLIHEWDYLTYLFGFPMEVKHMIGKKSELEIDSDDYAIYIADYKDKIIELHLDYFGRKTIREIQLFTKNETIIGDIANNKLISMPSGKTVVFEEERDDYQKRELNCFTDMVLNLQERADGYHHGLEVLELTQGKVRI